MATQLNLVYDERIFNGSPFTPIGGPSQGFEQRAITKYLYDGSQPNAVDLAVELIAKIKKAGLCLTFSDADASIRKELETNPYMIIHGSAVSLVPTLDTPKDVSFTYLDVYFSKSWLEEPVRCSQGHYLEKKRADHWVTNLQKDECPLGGHTIGPLVVDEPYRDEVRKAKEAWDKARAEQSLQSEQIPKLTSMEQELTIHRETRLLSSLQKARLIDKIRMIGGDVIKIVGRSLCILASSNITSRLLRSEAAKNFLQKSLERVAHEAFIISCFTSIAFAFHRLHKYSQGLEKEKNRAIGEFTAAACSFIPIWGMPLSLLIDIGLLYKDYTNPGAVEEIEQNTPPSPAKT
jgi:hypothetical protein